MQERRSNSDRSQTTREALLRAARDLFVQRSYAGTGTPDLVAAAGVTRGALYHHYADKRALFQAVIEREAAAVATAVRRAVSDDDPPLEALLTGSEAFLDAMAVPGRTRLLLIEAPAVLGRDTMARIDADNGGLTLREGLAAAMTAGVIRRLPLDAATELLSSAFDRAALAIEAGSDREEWRAVLDALMEGLQTQPNQR